MALAKAKLAPTTECCLSAPGRGAYRRSRTTAAPRKRTALTLFSCYGSLRHPSTELNAANRLDCLDSGCGGPGGRMGSGGGNGGNGWGAGGGNGGEGSPLNRNGAAALAAALGAAGFFTIANDAPRRDGREDGLPGLLALPGLATSGAFVGDDDETLVMAPSDDEVLPGPSQLTRSEIDLYLPRQYHIRENIYIH